MTSYTEEEKRKAVEMVEECGGSVMRTTLKSGYSSRQAFCQWLNERDVSHERKAGGPWGHCGPALRVWAIAFVRSGMTGRDVAEMLGVSSAAIACNPVGAAENPSRPAADRSPAEQLLSICSLEHCGISRNSTANIAFGHRGRHCTGALLLSAVYPRRCRMLASPISTQTALCAILSMIVSACTPPSLGFQSFFLNWVQMTVEAVPHLSSIVMRELLGRLAVKIVTALMNTRKDQPDGDVPNSLIFKLPFDE